MAEAAPAAPAAQVRRSRVVVVADDLIWASRLVAAVERAGHAPVRVASLDALPAALASAERPCLLVDLDGRAYDAIAAIGVARDAGSPVIAVGQHEDVALRKRALAAGAERVYSYGKFHTDGPAIVARWLGAEAT